MNFATLRLQMPDMNDVYKYPTIVSYFYGSIRDERSRVRFPATTLGKLFTPTYLDADSLYGVVKTGYFYFYGSGTTNQSSYMIFTEEDQVYLWNIKNWLFSGPAVPME